MNTNVLDPRVRTYLDAVRAHFDDLPADDRDELLEDLEEHLLEVAAEADGTLEERLGPAVAYAEELRASAGLPSRDAVASRRWLRSLADRAAASGIVRTLRTVVESGRARSMREFVGELRPGWWVLRGYLVVPIIQILRTDGHLIGGNLPIPQVSGSRVVGGLAVAASLLASMALGRRHRARARRSRLAVVLNLAVIGSALVALSPDPSYQVPDLALYGYSPGILQHSDGAPIANFCPYSSDGKLLSGVLLFDQDGRPIVDTAQYLQDGRPVQRLQPSIPNAYPQALNVPDPAIVEPVALSCPKSVGAVEAQPAAPGVPTPIPGSP